LLEWAVAIARLPRLVQAQRQTETYFAGQQERIADNLNRTSLAVSAETRNRADLAETFRRSIAEVATEQKRIAWLQHQQLLALVHDRQEARSIAFEGNGQPAPAQDARRNMDDLYAAFQNEFRAPAETRENLKTYLPLLDDALIDSDVLDIGCGSGQWLELLREHGIRGRGIESNRTLIAEARARNLEVVEADAIRFLRTLPESTLQAVTAFHFVEHLSLEQLVDLLIEVRRTLKPNGLLIIETPNPKNLVVGACNFFADPTHQRPLFPESLEFICKHLGFENNRIQYLHPVDGSPFTAGEPASQALHSWFFSARDYAIIANNSAA
jgi:SAM-dependent methyltransferase